MSRAAWSIRNKIVAIVLLTTTFSLGLGFAFVFLNDVRSFKRDLTANAVVIARVAAENSVSDLAFGDSEESARTLAKLSSIPEIEAVYLFNPDGTLFSQWTRHRTTVAPLSKADAGLRKFDGRFLYVTERIVYHGENYGTIHLLVSTGALDARIRTDLLTLVLLLVVLVLVSLFVASRLEMVISKPILKLAEVARHVSEHHDYAVRADKVSSDEIGVLSDGFNEMLHQIEKRQRERDEADQRTREKSQFLANMSHELRTPLNAIIGFSEILKTRLVDRLSARELKFVENIHSSGEHLLGIVNDVLDLSKIEAGRMDIRPEEFVVSSAVEGVCALMRGISARRQVTIAIDVAADLPTLHADPVKVKQVLYNLLSNAVKFSHERSEVKVQATFATAQNSPIGVDSIRFDVIDHGIGIDPKNHDLIFGEFQQIDGTGSRQVEGTGLGLALVRKFVQMHGGVIRLDSQLGSGSTFTVFFPQRFRGVQPQEAEVRPPAADDPRPRVLVIEDEPAAFDLIRQQLEKTSFAAVWARSGEEGLLLARTVKPVAITLDIILPGMEGWDVLKALKAEAATRDIPVAIVSIVDSRELGIAFGAEEYLVKPVDPAQLRAVLARFSVRNRERSVLVVDDDREFHDAVESNLAPHGYRLSHLYGAGEGVERAAGENPGLVIVDLTMRDMEGLELALKLKSDPRTSTLPILAVAAQDMAPDDGRIRGKITTMMRKSDAKTGRLVSVIEGLVRGRPAGPPTP